MQVKCLGQGSFHEFSLRGVAITAPRKRLQLLLRSSKSYSRKAQSIGRATQRSMPATVATETRADGRNKSAALGVGSWRNAKFALHELIGSHRSAGELGSCVLVEEEKGGSVGRMEISSVAAEGNRHRIRIQEEQRRLVKNIVNARNREAASVGHRSAAQEVSVHARLKRRLQARQSNEHVLLKHRLMQEERNKRKQAHGD